MALKANVRMKIGRREYAPGERLAPEHESELRRRPIFADLLEDGDVVKVRDAPKVPEPPPSSDPPPVDPVIAALNNALGTTAASNGESEPQAGSEGFPCPYCEYVAKKEVGLKVHLGRDHKDKVRPRRRKR